MFFFRKNTFTKIFFAITTLLLLAVFLNSLLLKKNSQKNRFKNIPEKVISKVNLNDDALFFEINSSAGTVEEFLKEQQIELRENDEIFPRENSRVFSGANIIIRRSKKISLIDNDKETNISTLCREVTDVLRENKIDLKKEDIVSPGRESLITDGLEIKIIRVEIKEEIAQEYVDFEKITETNEKMGWRESKIKQKGEKGVREIKYKVIYHNHKEISREVLETETIKNPLSEIVEKGSYVELGKSHKGLASWYAAKSMTAANPWLPMGSYVKVTNRANGKSVIVQIADRGPFGNGRIIDLEKTAFQKIAPLGQGIADVKMEEILN